MVKHILQKIKKEIIRNKETIFLILIIILLVLIINYFNKFNTNTLKENFTNNNANNNSKNNNANNESNMFKKNTSTKNIDFSQIRINILNSINSKLNIIEKEMNKLSEDVNKNVDSKNLEFVNISGIESFSGLPFMNENFTPSLELNIDNNMSPLMQLKRIKVVLLDLKKRFKNDNKNDNKRVIETFNNMNANEILQEIGTLLHDISKKNIDKEITQEENSDYTVEEEIIIRENNKNQEDRKRDKDLGENVYIESIESEGIDTIYHPRIQII